MSRSFQQRLFSQLPGLIDQFGTSFHIYDLMGILGTAHRMNKAFEKTPYRQYFAVKALPLPEIMLALRSYANFGFDCSSVPELALARGAGAFGEDIMFTSNDTSAVEIHEASEHGGCLLNLDDISLINEVPDKYFPDVICFRINPGKTRTGNSIIGNPFDSKYGITLKQVVPAYRLAMERGATRFGIHTMVCSNELRASYMVETVRGLLNLCITLKKKLGIECEFINMGGGFGIPYRPFQGELKLEWMADRIVRLLESFERTHGWRPNLMSECGRHVTGPHGVLVSRVINEKHIYKHYLGVESAMTALVRPAMYGAYHHVDILDSNGVPRGGPRRKMSIVGPLCENCDRLATDRLLPISSQKGDIVITHDTGAHGSAMTGNYNGRTRPQELLMFPDGRVKMIRRAETQEDLFRTLVLPDGFGKF